MLQIMAYDTPYIEKNLTKNIDTTISLYVLAEVIVKGIIILSSPTLGNYIAQQMILMYIYRRNKTSAKIAVVLCLTFIGFHNLKIVVILFSISININN